MKTTEKICRKSTKMIANSKKFNILNGLYDYGSKRFQKDELVLTTSAIPPDKHH